MLHHWVRAGVEYPDYPYARFDVHLEKLSYNEHADGAEGGVGTDTVGGGREGGGVGTKKDDSNDHATSLIVVDAAASAGKKSDKVDIFKEYLRDQNWTQSETDALLNLCQIHELRWPIIMDRWMSQFGPLCGKKVEDLQHRYYTIGTILNRKKVERAVQVEAEKLAKALAVGQSGVNNSAIGGADVISIGVGMGVGGDGVKNNAAGSLSFNALDSQSKEKLVTQHALAHSMVISSSATVSTMVGDVKASIQPPIPSINTGTSNQPIFDLQTERQRRRILEMIWLRSKEEELEEAELVKELKAIETQIRRLKKSGGHILAAAAASSTTSTNANSSQRLGINSNTAGSTPTSSRGTSPVPPPSFGVMTAGKDTTDSSYSMLHAQFSSTAPTPTPGTPYLQSGRLVQPATGGHLSINKTTLKRMGQVLKELNIMERPIPTKRVCDMYDHVRKGALTLLTLQKVMLKKEGEVVSRMIKLEKIAGTAVAREVANEAAATSAVTTSNLGSTPSASALIMKGNGSSSAAGGGNCGVATTHKSSGGGSKKTGGGKGKGTKKKSGDGSKSGTKRKFSSKKAAAATVFTNNAGVSNSGGPTSVVSVSGGIAPLTPPVSGVPIGIPGGVASSSQTHASSKGLKIGDAGDTGRKENKKRARKN